MECPKCRSPHIRLVAVITTPSTLERYDDDEQAWVEGYSCIMCGYWADAGSEPLRPLPPRVAPVADESNTMAGQVRRHFDLITAQRATCCWKQICRDLARLGAVMSPNTLQKLYGKERSRRRAQLQGEAGA